MGEGEGEPQKLPHRKLFRVGGSVVIVMPKDWLEQHGYEEGKEVPYIMNRELVFLSPQGAKEAYDHTSKFIKKAKEQVEKENIAEG